MNIKTTSILCFVLTLLIAQSGFSQVVSKPKKGLPGSWKVIGTTVAAKGVDHDIIRVTGSGDNFRKLKFKVTDSGLHMLRIVVNYDNGGTQKIDIRQNIPQGGESRVIDLKGDSRSIRSIKFWYEDKGILNGKAKVTVFGRK